VFELGEDTTLFSRTVILNKMTCSQFCAEPGKIDKRYGYNHGCGTGTQISGSGFSSRHLIVWPEVPAPVPTSAKFLIQNDLVHCKVQSTVIFAQLACPTNEGCEAGTQIQTPAPAPLSKSF